ncbi:hypothetical protein GCM10027605_14300 [Micromonospora zhanjiangensis]
MVGRVDPFRDAVAPGDGEVFPLGPTGRHGEQSRRRVRAGHPGTRAGGEQGGVAGAGADVQHPLAGADPGRVDHRRRGGEQAVGHGGIVTRGPGVGLPATG